jgi:hypothetical protein
MVLASTLHSFRAHRLVTTKCKCGFLIARDVEFLEANKMVICSDCGRLYSYRFDEERKRVQFEPQQASWACIDCETVHRVDPYELKLPQIVECSGCSEKFEISTKTILTRIAPKSKGTPDVAGVDLKTRHMMHP